MGDLQVLHTAQLDDRKLLSSQVGQVDDMYESLAAHEQKVPTADQVKHDDLTEALATFQQQLTEVTAHSLAASQLSLPNCVFACLGGGAGACVLHSMTATCNAV